MTTRTHSKTWLETLFVVTLTRLGWLPPSAGSTCLSSSSAHADVSARLRLLPPSAPGS